jgi:hypothetical protein
MFCLCGCETLGALNLFHFWCCRKALQKVMYMFVILKFSDQNNNNNNKINTYLVRGQVQHFGVE